MGPIAGDLANHGERTHGYFIYEGTLHLPLMVHWPTGSTHPGARVFQPAGLIDVAPTALDSLGIPAPALLIGTSLLRQPPTIVFGESFHCHDLFGWAPLLSARGGDVKYIDAPHPDCITCAWTRENRTI